MKGYCTFWKWLLRLGGGGGMRGCLWGVVFSVYESKLVLSQGQSKLQHCVAS